MNVGHCPAAMRSYHLLTSLVVAGLLGISCGGSGDVAPGGEGATGGGTGTTGGTGGTGATGGKKPTSTGGKPTQSQGGTGDMTDGGTDTAPVGGGAPEDKCGAGWLGKVAKPSVECDLVALEDSGESLTGDIDADRTLSSGKTYKLKGPTRILPGVTLTIPPCVKIIGEGPTSVLVAMPGDYGNVADTTPVGNGKLEAKGEADAPIIFTSSQPAGKRLPGDWGGVMLLGNAHENTAVRAQGVVTRPAIEGLDSQVQYGWDTDEFDDESSGSIEYVRIEYASREVRPGEETNGLTFGAVGSGTTIDHVMVSNSNDDCFEWFGGTVNASHLIAYNCDDDEFDTDHGFSGHVQFAFGRQIDGTLELDSGGFEFDTGVVGATPQSTPQFSNVTLCGTRENPPASGTAPRTGMALRTLVGGAILNTLVTGFENGGIAVTDNPANHPEIDFITVTNSTVFDNSSLYDATPFRNFVGPTWFQDQEGNSIERPENFCNCFSNPPMPWPTATIDGGAPDGFSDDKASYQGAFQDSTAESNWMLGKWVDWSNE